MDITTDTKGRTARVEQGARAWDFGYDARNRPVSRTDAAGHVTLFGYDAADRLTSTTDPGGAVTAFEYDAADERTAVILPSGRRQTLGRDADGRWTSYAPSATAGATRTRAHDTSGRLTTDGYAGATGATTSGYDAGGRLATLTAPDATTSIGYLGASDRAASVTRSPAGGGADDTLGFAWDGPLATAISASAGSSTTSYTNDLLPASTTVATDAGQVTTAFGRDADGLLTTAGPFTIARGGPGGAVSSMTAGSSTATFGHDASGTQTHRRFATGSTAYDQVLSRDDAGRITQRTETLDGTAHVFDYHYDARPAVRGAARRRRRRDLHLRRGRQPHRPRRPARWPGPRHERVGGVTYGWTAAGFLHEIGSGTQLDYGARGELLSATAGGATVTYRYDGLGRRTAREQGGEVTATSTETPRTRSRSPRRATPTAR